MKPMSLGAAALGRTGELETLRMGSMRQSYQRARTGLKNVMKMAAVVAMCLPMSMQPAGAAEDKSTLEPALYLHAPQTVTGQTATLLPDGRWLLVGGTDASGAHDSIL